MLNWLQKRYLRKHFDWIKAKNWTRLAKKQFDILIPQIPYIGDSKYYFSKYILMSAMLTPIVKIPDKENISERIIGQLIFELAEMFYNIMPKFIRRKQGKKIFTKDTKEEWQQRCLASQKKNVPFDWACEFVDGEGENFEYGFNMTKCGNVEFWKVQGLEKYTPYLCLCDWPGWKAMDVIATRTKTLAFKDEYCDFRYVKLGKDGYRGWPPETLPEWKKKKDEN
jgi:hypothetical protein